LGYCKYTTAGNISHCPSDFWIFYYKFLHIVPLNKSSSALCSLWNQSEIIL